MLKALNMLRSSTHFACLVALFVATAAATGCADGLESPGPNVPLSPERADDQHKQSIKDGTIDKTHDAIVAIVGPGLCSGTLIAPNLVLTARHCISGDSSGRGRGFDCRDDEFTDPVAPDEIGYVSTDHRVISRDGQPVRNPSVARRVSEVHVPRSDDQVCGADIALLRLSQSISRNETKPIPPRFSRDVQAGELIDAIGYGIDGRQQGTSGVRRIREDQKIADPNYRPKEYSSRNAKCQGDSGSGDIVDDRKVVGVTVRSSGNCRRTVSTNVYDWRDFIVRHGVAAAKAGSYSPPEWTGLEDQDGDGKLDDNDNCPKVANPLQKDTDDDGKGDACDADDDDDGVEDDQDNCPKVPNAEQTDTDGDGTGDVCDADDDDDGVEDDQDNCPKVPNAEQRDADNDGTGDACTTDDDGDGVEDDRDNCPRTPNEEQTDTDGDGKGDTCDGDVDGDGVDREEDNCPKVPNPDQANLDGDELGDACDSDIDADTILNEEDNCPRTPNPAQTDSDGDGKGDACTSSSEPSNGASPDAGMSGDVSFGGPDAGSGSSSGTGAASPGSGCSSAGDTGAPPLGWLSTWGLLGLFGLGVRLRRRLKA